MNIYTVLKLWINLKTRTTQKGLHLFKKPGLWELEFIADIITQFKEISLHSEIFLEVRNQ